ncbi:MAG: c-type cytochrome [Gemmatimonadota bacterium]|nr:MAG: c-type cytochrome [Gemmatimonadota bacterium]
MSQDRCNGWFRSAYLAFWVAALTVVMPAAGSTQIPEEFTNLKVLPDDIEQRQLMNAMRSFSRGLGVRCEYCHVGEPGQPLRTFDFASDEKEPKLKAREMMRMVRAINGEHLTNLSERSDPAIEVQCATCHHGQARPLTLQQALLESYANGGITGTVQEYRHLRERYFGTWTYDFGEQQLVGVAQQLGSRGSHEDGIAILELNLEFFPQSAVTVFTQGEIYLAQGDTAAAVTKYRASLELDPDNRAAQRRLSELGGV